MGADRQQKTQKIIIRPLGSDCDNLTELGIEMIDGEIIGVVSVVTTPMTINSMMNETRFADATKSCKAKSPDF